MRIRTLATRAAIVAVAVIALPASLTVGAPLPLLAPCATEDQVTDCYWDAARGTGEGRSFVVRGGVVTYADGETVAVPASELEGVTR